MLKLRLFLIFLLLFFWSCHPKISEREISYKKVPGFRVNKIIRGLKANKQGLPTWEDLREPLENTLKFLHRKKFNELFLPGLTITKEKLIESIQHLIRILPDLDKDPYILKKDFDFYQLTPNTFFTGYFGMDVEASLTKDNVYKYPIYGVPRDLKRADLGKFHPRWKGEILIYRLEKDSIAPYYTREEIEKNGAINKKAKVLAWAKNPVDLFFLQIQGSGRLILPDGTFKYIGYAGKNGRQYVSIGKYMIEKGLIAPGQATLDGIAHYLNAHPELLPDILYINPSYVFFRFLKDGPIGAAGIKLTGFASMATDPHVIPLGAIGIYDVVLPIGKKGSRVVGAFMSQDVGGAITNNHVDLFLGWGENARKIAGSLSTYGKIYLLLKK
ncbi:murein transglycosylase A [Desulfothermus okinawensis JCM 13304]